ncbi:hypothetical protein ACMC56_16055 [Campylobacterota bacterium DY0563]
MIRILKYILIAFFTYFCIFSTLGYFIAEGDDHIKDDTVRAGAMALKLIMAISSFGSLISILKENKFFITIFITMFFTVIIENIIYSNIYKSFG